MLNLNISSGRVIGQLMLSAPLTELKTEGGMIVCEGQHKYPRTWRIER